jgi:hypothetical protein
MKDPYFSKHRLHTLRYVGLTLMLAGYFAVWLPGPSAGLTIIGLELGEWIKFLGVGSRRDLFYVPPIAIGLLLALITADWPNHRWQTWGMRCLAIGVSMLAFPAIAAITLEPRSEWLVRVISIGLVIQTVVLSSVVYRSPRTMPAIRRVMLLIALLGVWLPTGQYLAIRPVVMEIMHQPVGFGPGLLANLLGGSIVAVSMAAELWNDRNKQKAAVFYDSAAYEVDN